MCWSGEASLAVTVAGAASTLYAVHKKESRLLWLPMIYFSLMELLQAYTYRVIDHCEMPSNQMATLLGYLHICFQPFFCNAVALYFIPRHVARKVAPVAYTICFAAAIMMLIKLYPLTGVGQCTPGIRPMCGAKICSIHGNWHIAWSLPINDVGEMIPSYLIAAFIIPALYGSWRWTLFHLLAGPVLARLTTSNMNEWPAVWCLLSIDLLIIIVNTRVRHALFVRKWPFWDKFPKSTEEKAIS